MYFTFFLPSFLLSYISFLIPTSMKSEKKEKKKEKKKKKRFNVLYISATHSWNILGNDYCSMVSNK